MDKKMRLFLSLCFQPYILAENSGTSSCRGGTELISALGLTTRIYQGFTDDH